MHRRQLSHILEAVIVIPLGTLVSILPRGVAKAIGRITGLMGFYLDRRDKSWAYRNLDIIYGEKRLSKGERDRILKRLFVNIGIMVVEFLKMRDITAKNYSQFVTFGNVAPLLKGLDQGRGVLVITAHLGNWEILGSACAKLGFNVAALIKRLHNPYTDRWIKRIREQQAGVKCYYHDERSIFRTIGVHLKKNGIFAFLSDQAYLSNPLFIPFFGVPCETTDAPARLHLWFEAPIVLAFALKQGDRYQILCEGPYSFERTADMKRDCERIMTLVNERFEALVRKHPDQWFSLITPRWRDTSRY